jgi:FkbM family methyltransferase
LSKIDRLATLASALEGAPLICVDVGARGGAFPPLRLLAPWVHYCAFEPEVGEAERLRVRLGRSGWRQVTVVPKALAAQDGTVELFLTDHEGLSSTLRPDRGVGERFCHAQGFAPKGAFEVEATTLRRAAAEHGFDDAAFLKLDTQGTEVEILASGEDILRNSALAVYVEVLLQPFYAGQGPIGGVFGFLAERGFAVVDLQRTFLRRAGFDPTLFSRRQVVWAHALFMREPDHGLVRRSADMLARYVGLAVAFDQYDAALEAIRGARTAGVVTADLADQLVGDVVELARERTEEIMGSLPGPMPAAGVLACAHKDRRHGPQ